MATYRHWSVSLWRDPDDVSHCRIQSPDKTEWRLISATFCRWGRCFVADQLWLMTRIREEEDCSVLFCVVPSVWVLWNVCSLVGRSAVAWLSDASNNIYIDFGLLVVCFSLCRQLMWRRCLQWTGILTLLWASHRSLLSWRSSIASSSASLRQVLHCTQLLLLLIATCNSNINSKVTCSHFNIS